jgi:carbamoyl-phosphate synthase small subunit
MSNDLRLVLEDGHEFSGRSFGAAGPVAGEVVFNTSMAGYVESLTDPSYRGQILVMTYPLVGNYGVPAPRAHGTLARPYESERIQPQGLIVQAYSDHYSHHAATRSLGQWLAQEGVPGLTGVDTRVLTQLLRKHGTMQGWLLPAGMSIDEGRRVARSVEMSRDVFDAVAPKQPVTHAGGEIRVLVVDCGAKDQIVRSLLERQATVVRAPWNMELEPLARDTDAILIGNGPGDPQHLGALSQQVRNLMSSFPGPIFGLCLGHQILAMASGARTYKLPYGHRGINQPVQDLETRRCYITSQNHGYAVDEATLPTDWEPWFVNVNDGTNEGLRSRNGRFFSVQFHPEASPGPRDTGFLFDDFLRLAASHGRRG